MPVSARRWYSDSPHSFPVTGDIVPQRMPSGPGGMRYPAPEIGTRFGLLVVTSAPWVAPTKGQQVWTVCQCGQVTIKRVAHLLRGMVQSCGCIRGGRTLPLLERFWSKVDRRGPDECWPWLGGARTGYGILWSGGSRGVGATRPATHIAWEIVRGESVPEGMFLCHKCDNPPCVNPAHLFLGTQTENMADCAAKGRTSSGPKHSAATSAGRRRGAGK